MTTPLNDPSDEASERAKYATPPRAAAPAAQWFTVPTLANAHLTLRPLTIADAALVLQAYDTPEAYAYSGPGHLPDLAAAQAYVEQTLARERDVAFLQLAADGSPIGVTTFYDIDVTRRQLAIGYTWFSRRVWGSGTNAASKLLLLTYAFETLGAVKVIWHVDKINLRSRAAVTKLGATFESFARKDRLRPDGTWRDTAVFSLLDEEWPAAKVNLESRLVTPA